VERTNSFYIVPSIVEDRIYSFFVVFFIVEERIHSFFFVLSIFEERIVFRFVKENKVSFIFVLLHNHLLRYSFHFDPVIENMRE